jgi:spore maturation protein CgeB
VRIVYFTHSLASCWNHGNAHFLRGVIRELKRRGHEVRVFEPADSWSLSNLIADQGKTPLDAFKRNFPDLSSVSYRDPDIERMTQGADAVIVHEWTDHSLVAALGEKRRLGARFLLLFHDTHHRAASDPASLPRRELEKFDAILAFGESLAKIYRGWGWGSRAFTWHEAADTTHFYPRPTQDPQGAVWIGNWGDGERSEELETYLFGPAAAADVPLTIHGVRYPPEALARLREIGASYLGWLANADAPDVFARHLFTAHVPRRLYTEQLPGIPTIRVFEALACGIPLASADWPDVEGLFRPGQDYLVARSGEEMRRHFRALKNDPSLRSSLAESGLARIRERHSCAHRVEELMSILARLGTAGELRESA